MKKTLSILCGYVLLGSSAMAKANPGLLYTCYEVDGIVTYDVAGCVPGSTILFYSKPCGGDILNKAVTDADGHARVTWTGEQTPAFVLNKPGAKGDKASGNGMVAFTPGKAFSIGNMDLMAKDGITAIKWQATFDNPELYTIEVLKAANGTDYALAGSFAAQPGAGAVYTFSERSPEHASVTYKIQVRSADRGALFISLPMQGYDQGTVSVYPTIARSVINIRLRQNNTGVHTYKLLDAQGRLQGEGLLSNDQNSVDVAKLPAGTYYLQVTEGNKKTTAKFVKEG